MGKEKPERLHNRTLFLYQLGLDLDRISYQRASDRVIRFILRRLGETFEADVALQVGIDRSDRGLQPPYRLDLRPNAPRSGPSNEQPRAIPTGAELRKICRRFLSSNSAPEDRKLLLIAVCAGNRVVGILAFYRHRRQFSRADARLGQDAAAILSSNLTRRERDRAQKVREKISMKIFSELRPQDVLYQILHGLKRLYQYDHSAAVLLLSPDRKTLNVQAEIISWTKAKSDRIGDEIPVTPEVKDWIDRLSLPILIRDRSPSEAGVPDSLVGPLDSVRRPSSPPARGMILAVLRRNEEVLGLLQILGKHEGAFTPGDLITLAEFLPLASSTLYNSELYATQYSRLVTAERKVRLADLARAISHDLNNAFGVIIPLLQALQRDIGTGEVSLAQISKDLGVVEHYASASARIFQGLLSIGRGKAEPYRWFDLNSLLDATLDMIAPNLREHRVEVVRELDREIPTVCLRRGEIEQVILNLVYNARDAMPQGGLLRVGSRRAKDGVAFELSDEGEGVPEGLRERIFEPFFTTKETGSGLGLDICRSIVWEYDGRLDLTSKPGQGTTARVWLPRCCERVPDELREAGGLTSPLTAAHSDGGTR